MSVTFTKLFSSITESTVWCEPMATRIVWITMLAMSDKMGRVWASIPGLANRARVSLEECEAALERFQQPDKYSRTPDNDGRRIEQIDGGWRLLNYDKYREISDEESRREYKRKWDQAHRGKGSDDSRQIPTNSDKSDSDRLQPTQAEAEAEAEAEAVNLKPTQPSGCVHPPAKNPPDGCPPCPIDEIVALYHETLPELPRFLVRNATRDGYIRSRWREFFAAGDFTTREGGIECFRWLFAEQVKPSKFLTGRSDANGGRKPFSADLEWLMRPTNFAKVIEGKYAT